MIGMVQSERKSYSNLQNQDGKTKLSISINAMQYYRIIALISANIVLNWDIEGHELASICRYPNEGQYSPISVR